MWSAYRAHWLVQHLIFDVGFLGVVLWDTLQNKLSLHSSIEQVVSAHLLVVSAHLFAWGGGVGIMGMWEFGGICELLFKLPRVGVGAFLFAPRGYSDRSKILVNGCLVWTFEANNVTWLMILQSNLTFRWKKDSAILRHTIVIWPWRRARTWFSYLLSYGSYIIRINCGWR